MISQRKDAEGPPPPAASHSVPVPSSQRIETQQQATDYSDLSRLPGISPVGSNPGFLSGLDTFQQNPASTFAGQQQYSSGVTSSSQAFPHRLSTTTSNSPISSLEQSHGTLVISSTGRSKYLGPTAASEWLKDVSASDLYMPLSIVARGRRSARDTDRLSTGISFARRSRCPATSNRLFQLLGL